MDKNWNYVIFNFSDAIYMQACQMINKVSLTARPHKDVLKVMDLIMTKHFALCPVVLFESVCTIRNIAIAFLNCQLTEDIYTVA